MNDLSENTRIFTEKYKTSHQEIQKIPPAGPSLKGFSLTMNDLSENTKIFTEKYKKIHREIQKCSQRNTKKCQKIPPAGPSRAFLNELFVRKYKNIHRKIQKYSQRNTEQVTMKSKKSHQQQGPRGLFFNNE